MNNKDIDQARKLSNTEMEGQKGGATFGSLSRFIVNVKTRPATFGSFNPAADSVMCAGQTRSIVLDPGLSQISQVSLRSFG